MTLNGFDYPAYPDEINAYEMGWMDCERGNGQNPWSRGTVEAMGWRNGYTHACQTYEVDHAHA
jgi:hypothetical protein